MIFYQADSKKETLWRAMVDAMAEAANLYPYYSRYFPHPNKALTSNIGAWDYSGEFMTLVRASQYRDTNE